MTKMHDIVSTTHLPGGGGGGGVAVQAGHVELIALRLLWEVWTVHTRRLQEEQVTGVLADLSLLASVSPVSHLFFVSSLSLLCLFFVSFSFSFSFSSGHACLPVQCATKQRRSRVVDQCEIERVEHAAFGRGRAAAPPWCVFMSCSCYLPSYLKYI